MSQLFILSAKRTPFGSFGGKLKGFTATDLAVHASKAALADVKGLEASQVGSSVWGNVAQTSVDAAYMARHVAKNIVAAGLADRCEVQLAYAIGVSEPVSVHVDTEGTGKVEDERLCEVVRDVFPLTPRGIIDYLDLRRPIFRRTAAGGHFGRDEFPWEKTDKAKQLAQAARAAGAVA
jgi:S-adenosylmethionine synthetase